MRQEKYYNVYISANHPRNTVLYAGVTNSIFKRENQHKEKINTKSFTARYNVNKVVYCETFNNIRDAIIREKQIKAGSRQKKIDLINSINPEWKDLTKEFLE